MSSNARVFALGPERNAKFGQIIVLNSGADRGFDRSGADRIGPTPKSKSGAWPPESSSSVEIYFLVLASMASSRLVAGVDDAMILAVILQSERQNGFS